MRKGPTPTSYDTEPRKIWVSISPIYIAVVDVRQVVQLCHDGEAVHLVACCTHFEEAWRSRFPSIGEMSESGERGGLPLLWEKCGEF